MLNPDLSIIEERSLKSDSPGAGGAGGYDGPDLDADHIRERGAEGDGHRGQGAFRQQPQVNYLPHVSRTTSSHAD